MSKHIYGVRKLKPLDIPVIQNSIIKSLQQSYISSIVQISSVVDVLVQLRYELLFIGNISGRSTTTAPVMVRLIWIGNNPRVRFDKTNRLHIMQLKDAYLSMKEPWQQDPLFS